MYLGVKRPGREFNRLSLPVTSLRMSEVFFMRHTETGLYVTSIYASTDIRELKLLIWMRRFPSVFSN